MKHRVVSLFLALILLVSLLVMPASALSAGDVVGYLATQAVMGEYDSSTGWRYETFSITADNSLFYGIYYLEEYRLLDLTVFSDSFAVSWRIQADNPAPPYEAYITIFDEQYSTGTVSLAANYNGADYQSFKSFTGNTSAKAQMLTALNYYLPAVVEVTRAVLMEEANSSLADLGLKSYKICKFVHVYDRGKITKQPTCVGFGVKTYTCKICGATRTEQVEPTGVHKYGNSTVIVEPTCTTEGVKRSTCTVCKTAIHDEPVPALGHAWSYTETLTPGEGKEHGTALYTCTRCQETKEGRLCAAEVFTDMPSDDNWAHTPIDWAYFSGVTSGKTATTFAPKATVTRAEVVSFLYKAMGSPEPVGTENPFTDVAEGKYYYKPVLWAVGAGVTTGATPTSFAPKKNCTRAQIVTFLWNAAGKPEPAAEENPFTDVSEGKYYYKAVLWASQNGVTGGITATTFGPGKACTRAQTVTFLYKANELLTADPLPEEPDPEPTPDPAPLEP